MEMEYCTSSIHEVRAARAMANNVKIFFMTFYFCEICFEVFDTAKLLSLF